MTFPTTELPKLSVTSRLNVCSVLLVESSVKSWSEVDYKDDTKYLSAVLNEKYMLYYRTVPVRIHSQF